MAILANTRPDQPSHPARVPSPPDSHPQIMTKGAQRLGEGSFSTPGISEPTSLSEDANQARNLRKRKATSIKADPVEEAMKCLTPEEKRSWKGWVELESDPMVFNHVVQAYGVKNVKIQEILEIDFLPSMEKPVHGLIFLFQYQDSDGEEAEDSPKCPKDVWFANQTTDNSCATVALLNIILNTPSIELGNLLSTFKEDTRKLKPAYRGKKLGENESIRIIHNSFVRRMDILNADLVLSNEYDRWIKRRRREEKLKSVQKSRNARNAKTKVTKPPPPKRKQEEPESGFHFIAYVPINGSVWKLDGLRRHPLNIGSCGDDWTTIARDNIHQRTNSHSGSLQYSLMALVDCPLVKLRRSIIQTVKSIEALEENLELMNPDWKAYIDANVKGYKVDLEQMFGVAQKDVDDAEILDETAEILNQGDLTILLKSRKPLGEQLTRLKTMYIEEIANNDSESQRSEARKHDLTPDIFNSIKAMSESGALKDVVLRLRD